MRASRIGPLAIAALFTAIAACSEDVTDPESLNDFSASLNGASEKPTAVATNATGTATFAFTGTTITYTVTYAGLTGGNPTAAHIHLGGPTQSGAVQVNLCGAGAAPACPAAASGTITGTADNTYLAANVQMSSVVNAMRGVGAYVNIHNATYSAGEIRGNIVVVP